MIACPFTICVKKLSIYSSLDSNLNKLLGYFLRPKSPHRNTTPSCGACVNKGTSQLHITYASLHISYCSKSLIDGLRYINVQYDLKTNIGRGRGLIRYFLTQNCLGDVMQTATADDKTLKMFYTEGALIRHGGMQHVVESLYALYNIQFAISPVSQNVSDLDINWPHMSSRIIHMPTVFPDVPSSDPPSVPYHSENIRKWLSSGIGSASDKPDNRSDHRSRGESVNPREAEMEEKQEILARVITDLEFKNTQLESQLNITEAELKIKPDKPERYGTPFIDY